MAHPQRIDFQAPGQRPPDDSPRLAPSHGHGPRHALQTLRGPATRFDADPDDEPEERELIFYCSRPSATPVSPRAEKVVETTSQNVSGFRGLVEVCRWLGFPPKTA